MGKEFRMFEFIILLKFIGALLITNSHMDELYPIAALSVGGGLGNVCFFLAAGFCISKKAKGSFRGWIISRFKRIYPSLWFITTVLYVAGKKSFSILKLPHDMLFPYRTYWFVTAIIIFYILFYFVIRMNIKQIKRLLIGTAVVYFGVYFMVLNTSVWSVEDAGFFKYIFYFGVMVIGYLMKLNWNDVTKINSRMLWGVVTSVSGILFIGLKLAMIKNPILYNIQFTVQFSALGFGIGLMLFLFSMEDIWRKINRTLPYKIVAMISASTLEIYYLNYVGCGLMKGIIFPINVVLAFIVIGICGCCVHSLIEKLGKGNS